MSTPFQLASDDSLRSNKEAAAHTFPADRTNREDRAAAERGFPLRRDSCTL